MDDIRAQLDALMGQDRNVPLAERDQHRSERKFTDDDVCKYFLCGFCPHEEFRRTKNDCGDCPSLHDDACKAQWDALDDRAKERYGYESELLRWFDRLLGDLRKRIDANTERLRGIEAPQPLSLDDQQRLDNMLQQINALLAQAATLGEQGEVDAAQAATAEAERQKVARGMFEVQAQARANAKSATRGLVGQQVCQVSGLIINNEESRLVDHHSGRNFNSWKKLHEVHAQLLEAQRKRREGGAGAGFAPVPLGGGGRGGGGGSGIDYRSSREGRRDDDPDRDRRRYDERDRERDRRYDRERDSGSRRYDERDRPRERDRLFRDGGSGGGGGGGGRDERDRRERERRPRSRSRDRAMR